jgi:putative flippase GtrA
MIKNFVLKNQQFFRFAIIGAVGATIETVIFLNLSNLGIYYLVANAIGFSVGVTVNFLLNLFFNFKTKNCFLCRFLSYYSVGLIGLLANSILLFVFVEFGNLSLLIAKILSLSIIVFMQFYLNKQLTFGKTLSRVKVCSKE